MTTADFAKYKAIIISDPDCGGIDRIQFLNDTKKAWSPAVTGNMILIGTDPTYHSSTRPGAKALMTDSVKFAGLGNGTGMYMAMSCYYQAQERANVESLSEFGIFTCRGNLACYNEAHLVANSSALTTVDDAKLSNWSCSVHEVFSRYPTSGKNGFEPLAIAQGATGEGERTFADNSTGVPYIISRGATPLGCGNGVVDRKFGEECDKGSENGMLDSLCSKSCKCLFGLSLVTGDCTANVTTSSTSSSSSPTSATLLTNTR